MTLDNIKDIQERLELLNKQKGMNYVIFAFQESGKKARKMIKIDAFYKIRKNKGLRNVVAETIVKLAEDLIGDDFK